MQPALPAARCGPGRGLQRSGTARALGLSASPGPSLHKLTHLPIPLPPPVPTTFRSSTFPSCPGQQSPADLYLPSFLPPGPLPRPIPLPWSWCCRTPSACFLGSGSGASRRADGRREGDRPEDLAESYPPLPPWPAAARASSLRQRSELLLSCLNPFRGSTRPRRKQPAPASPHL